jgi:hypothetical protein
LPHPAGADDTIAAGFLARWGASGSAERANYQLFLSELCDLLAVPRPDPTGPDDRDNAYVFERGIHFDHGDGSSSTRDGAPPDRLHWWRPDNIGSPRGGHAS